MHWAELAGQLFAAEQINSELGEKLVDNLLLTDAKFLKERKGYWTIKKEHQDPLTKYLDDAVFTIVDVETTGGRPPLHRIMEIAGVKIKDGKIVDRYSTLVNPGRYIPSYVANMTGINEQLVSESPTADEMVPPFLRFLGDSIFVAHNAAFDIMFVNHELRNLNMADLDNPALCTLVLARRLMPEMEKFSLDSLAQSMGIPIHGRHRALGDATATAHILIEFIRKASDMGMETAEDLIQLQCSGLNKDMRLVNSEWPLFADLPERPGVYLMKSRKGELLYLCGAKNIKESVKGQYYTRKRLPTKKVKMLEQIKQIEHRMTDSELGAVFLESKLRRRLRPGYGPTSSDQNLKPFVKITANKAFPRVYAVSRVLPDGAFYYGPYKSNERARAVCEAMNNTCKLRRCHSTIRPDGQNEPCEHFHQGECTAPCMGAISQARYSDAVHQAMKTLSHDDVGPLLIVQKQGDVSEPLPENTTEIESGKPFSSDMAPAGIGSTPVHLLDFMVALPGIYQGEVEIFFVKAGNLHKRMVVSVSDIQGDDALDAIQSCYFGKKGYSQSKRKKYFELQLIAGWLFRNPDSAAVVTADKDKTARELADLLQQKSAALWDT